MITTRMIEDTLLDHGSGLRLLIGPGGERELPTPEGAAAVVDGLRNLARIVIADLGIITDTLAQAGLQHASQVWIVTEPETAAVERAGAIIQTLERWGVRPKKIALIANQTNPVMRLGAAEIAQATGRDVFAAIPSAPRVLRGGPPRSTPDRPRPRSPGIPGDLRARKRDRRQTELVSDRTSDHGPSRSARRRVRCSPHAT